MAKKVSSRTHKTATRERVTAPNTSRWVNPNSRKGRRANARKAARAERKRRIAERVKVNPRLVRM